MHTVLFHLDFVSPYVWHALLEGDLFWSHERQALTPAALTMSTRS